MPTSLETCLTCYGAGETATERGPEVCPDCLAGAVSRTTRLEWRLRDIESVYRNSGRDTEAEVLWLVHELRQSRDALLRILAICQDADESDPAVGNLKFVANEALGLYVPNAGQRKATTG
jgi:hypothetical protein